MTVAVKRSQRMKILLTLAQRVEDEAAKRLGHMQGQVQQAQEQLKQIEDYNQAYKLEIQAKTTGLTARDIMSSRSFLERLGGAVKEQQERIGQMEAMQVSLLEQWQKKYHYRRSLADLIERIKKTENDALEKQLQSELDEMATQLYLRKAKAQSSL